MTSASVSNFLVQNAVAPNQEPGIKESDVNQNFKEMFLQSMEPKTVAFSNLVNSTKANDNVQKSDVVENTNKANQYQDKGFKVKQKIEKPVTEEDAKELVKEIETFAENVKEVISDELDVSKEEIDAAMETLGLTAVDLIDPANIAKLVMQVTGTDSPVELLTLDEFSNVMKSFDKLLDNLVENTNLAPDKLKSLVMDYSDVLSQVTEMPVVDEDNTQMAEMVVTEEVELIDANEQPRDVVIDSKDETEVTQNVPEETVGLTDKNAVATKNETSVDEEIKTDDYSSKEQVVLNNSDTEETKDNGSFEGQTKSQVQSKASDKISHTFDRADTGFTVETKPEISFDAKNGTVALADGRTVDVSNIIEQLVEQSKVTANQEVTKLEMLLNPEGLGKVYMELNQKGDEVTAKLYTQNEAVKEALESQMAVLKDNMNNGGGSKVTTIEVAVGTHEFERNLEENEHQRQQQEEANAQNRPARRSINLSNLDELKGLMTEEEALVAQIMKDNGNQVNFTA